MPTLRKPINYLITNLAMFHFSSLFRFQQSCMLALGPFSALLAWSCASFVFTCHTFLNCAYGFSRKIPFSLINSSDKQLLQLIFGCRILRRCVHHIYRIVFHVDVERLPVQHEHLRLYCANLKWHRNLSKVWRSTSKSTRWSFALIC